MNENGRIVDKKQKARTIFMSQKPVLVIMAAGMGSRYGGLKQIDPVDREGDLIIDFSIFDAVEAGFEKVVFIITIWARAVCNAFFLSDAGAGAS